MMCGGFTGDKAADAEVQAIIDSHQEEILTKASGKTWFKKEDDCVAECKDAKSKAECVEECKDKKAKARCKPECKDDKGDCKPDCKDEKLKADCDKVCKDAKSKTECIKECKDTKKPKLLGQGCCAPAEDKKASKIKVLSYQTQVVAGTNYKIKADIDGKHFQITIWQKLPCYGGETEVTDITEL